MRLTSALHTYSFAASLNKKLNCMQLIMNFSRLCLMAATAAVLFTSCKKDNSENGPTPPPAMGTKLKKVSMDNEVMEFGYGADGTLQTVKANNDLTTSGEVTTFNITYTADKKISELRSTGGPRIVAHYNNNQLATADIFENNTQIATIRYEYLNAVLKSASVEVQGFEALKFSFAYDAAGNVGKTTILSLNPLTDQLEVTGSTEYVYDSKTNPMHAHKNLMYLLLQNISKNNITKETERDELNAISETTEYTYTYNSQSLPQTAIVKTTTAGNPSVNSTMVFSYQ
jgi:hypothetical protein